MLTPRAPRNPMGWAPLHHMLQGGARTQGACGGARDRTHALVIQATAGAPDQQVELPGASSALWTFSQEEGPALKNLLASPTGASSGR